MSANFTPTRGEFTDLKPFRFWCQKVLPLVYDDSLSYYELLCKVVDYLNKTMEDVETLNDDITSMYTAFDDLQTYVNTYFDNLDVQTEINNKLDAMALDGSLSALIEPFIPDIVTGWLDDNIVQEEGYVIDKTLLVSDAAADALVTGDHIRYLNSIASNVSPNLYDKDASNTKTGYFADQTGWVSSAGNTRLGVTQPIFCLKGKTYKIKNYNGIYGSTNGITAFEVDNPTTQNIVSVDQTGSKVGDYTVITFTRTGYYVFDIDLAEADSIMFCEQAYYPAFYCGYGLGKMAYDYPNVFLTFDNDGTPEYLSIVEKSANLYDKTAAPPKPGYFATGTGWTSGGGSAILGTTPLIYLQAGKTYKFKSYASIYGNNAKYFYYVDDTTGEITKLKEGSYDQTGVYVVWTCNESGNYVVDINPTDSGTFMFCEASKYPDYYAEYGAYYAKDNVNYNNVDFKYFPLKDSVIVTDGDSISQGTRDYPENLGGWYGRLKAEGDILGYNYSADGASITYLAANRHCVSRYITTIYGYYPELDYLILEGGTNDADLIGQFSGDTPPVGFGTWTANDFSGSYDDTTFCGAVESLFYKATGYYPNAKIGFIIAMEMGTDNAIVANRKRYFDEIVKIAAKWHIPVLNLWDNAGADARLEAFYDSTLDGSGNVEAEKFYYDGQHPTSYGYNKMQTMIKRWIESL